MPPTAKCMNARPYDDTDLVISSISLSFTYGRMSPQGPPVLKKGTKKACRDFKGKTSSKDFFLIKTVFCLLSTVITKGSLANLSRFAGEHMQKIKEVFFLKSTLSFRSWQKRPNTLLALCCIELCNRVIPTTTGTVSWCADAHSVDWWPQRRYFAAAAAAAEASSSDSKEPPPPPISWPE